MICNQVGLKGRSANEAIFVLLLAVSIEAIFFYFIFLIPESQLCDTFLKLVVAAELEEEFPRSISGDICLELS